MAEKGRLTLESLQSTIRQKNVGWTAERTALSDLPLKQQKEHLGLRVTPEELKATQQAIAAASRIDAVALRAAAPAAVDWRNNNGNWVTPIRDQSSCGSCVAFATVATIEARINIVCKRATLNKDLSEAQVFYCGCGNCCGTGWNFAPALDFCKTTGLAEESAFPYTPGNQPCKQGLSPFVKLTNWTSVLTSADRKNVIATKGPMLAGMAVYQDFFSYQSGVYRHVSGALAGYHAICVIGYDDTRQCWICKNSWGTGWGESGFFNIGYGESIDSTFSFYDVDLTCPTPSPEDTCVKYVPVLKRVLTAAQSDLLLRACLRYYVCRRGIRRPICSPAHRRVILVINNILKLCPQYRAAFCRILG